MWVFKVSQQKSTHRALKRDARRNLNAQRLLRPPWLQLPVLALYTPVPKTPLEVKGGKVSPPLAFRRAMGESRAAGHKWPEQPKSHSGGDTQRDGPALGLPTTPSPYRSSTKKVGTSATLSARPRWC